MALILDQSYYGSDDDYFELRYGADYTKGGVQFIPTVTANVGKVTLRLQKEGTPSGNVWVELWTDNGTGEPISEVGQSNNVACSGISSVALSDVDFAWGTTYQRVAGNKYWYIFNGDYAESTSANIHWSIDNTTPSYPSTLYGRVRYATSVWTGQVAGNSQCFNFKEYYDDTTIVVSTAKGMPLLIY